MNTIAGGLPERGLGRRIGGIGVVNAVLVALLAAAAVGAYLAVSTTQGGAPGAVRTATVARGVVLSTVSATGAVEPATQLAVGFATGGTLTAVSVEPGQHVRQGQVLGRIDATVATEGVRQAETALRTAEAQFRQTLTGETPQQRRQDAVSVTQARLSTRDAAAGVAQARRTAALDRASGAASVAQAKRQLAVDRGQLKLDVYQRGEDATTYTSVAAAQAAVSADQSRLAAAQSRQRSDDVTQLQAQSQQSNDKVALAQAQSEGNAADVAKFTAAVNGDQQSLNALQTTVTEDGYAVGDAQSALTSDQAHLTALQADAKAIRGDEQKIAQDEQAVMSAGSTARTTAQRDAQSISAAGQQEASAALALRAAIAGNAVKQAPPTPAALAAARAAVVGAQVTLANARRTLAETTLRAPIPGVVASVSGTVGAEVSGGGTSGASSASSSSAAGTSSGSGSSGGGSSSSGFVTLTRLEGLEVVASFAETDAVELRVGQAATLTVAALPGRELAARVVGISPTATTSSGVVTYDVTFAVLRAPSQLRPGMTANVDVVTAEQDGVLDVPTAAVSGSGQNATVTVLRNGRQRTVPVVTGLRGDSSTAIVGGSLSAGDEVVLPSVSISAVTTATGSAGSGSSGTFGGGRARFFGGAGGLGGG